MISNDIFIVISSKGGVGKTTFSTQYLIPFIYEETKKPVAIYEYDEVNFSTQYLKDSKIIATNVIKSSQKDFTEFEKKVQNILFDLDRDYPVVIDIGAENYRTAINDLVSNLSLSMKTKIHFFIPILVGLEDAPILIKVIKEIRSMVKDPNIIVVLSKANSPLENRTNPDELSEIEDEFYLPLGLSYNYKKGEINTGIFKMLNLPEQILSTKTSVRLIEETRSQFGITIYEMAEMKINGEFNKLNEERFKLSAKKDRTEEETYRFNLISRQLNLINKCFNYKNTYIMGENYSRFQKYIMSKK